VLAAKRRWQNIRKAAGKPFDKPNIVMSAAVQVCCEYVPLFNQNLEKSSVLTMQGRRLQDVRFFCFVQGRQLTSQSRPRSRGEVLVGAHFNKNLELCIEEISGIARRMNTPQALKN
jgi:hypothetical protein